MGKEPETKVASKGHFLDLAIVLHFAPSIELNGLSIDTLKMD